MSNQQIAPTIPFKSELDLARSELHSATIPLPVHSDAFHPVPRGGVPHHKVVHSVLSTDMHNTRPPPPPAPKASAIPVAVPNLTKKARGRQVPTTKEALLKPGITGRSYACKVESCRKVFTRSEHLKRHIRSIHTNERPFQCEEPECGKFFTRHDNLLQHRRSHRGHSLATSVLSGISGTSPVNPCDIPGPLERVYTGSTLVCASRQRQHTQVSATQSPIEGGGTVGGGATAISEPSSASAPATMGVLLPSPLTTIPTPSMYRIAIDESVATTADATIAATVNANPATTAVHSGRRASQGQIPSPTQSSVVASPTSSHSLSPLAQKQVYHHAQAGHPSLPPHAHGHVRRSSGNASVAVSSVVNEYHGAATVTPDPNAPGSVRPSGASSSTGSLSPTSPMSPASTTSLSSPSSYAVNLNASLHYDYIGCNGGGVNGNGQDANGSGSLSPQQAMSPLSPTGTHVNVVDGSSSAAAHAHPGYLSNVSCYYEHASQHHHQGLNGEHARVVSGSPNTQHIPRLRANSTSSLHVNSQGHIVSGYHGFHDMHAQQYANAGMPGMTLGPVDAHGVQYQSPAPAPFVHIQIPVQEGMVHGRRSFLQWRV